MNNFMNATDRLRALYAISPASTVVALPAGTYVIHAHDEDGETELEDARTGDVWDPNSIYPSAGDWSHDGERVSYEDLKVGDVAELLATVYLTIDDAEGL
jgi:hypothetical protein